VARFGDLLRSHRQAASLSQEELAIAAELSTRAIGNMERGLTTRPYPRTLRLLASALGLDDTAASELISAATSARRDEPPGTTVAPRSESAKMVRFLAQAFAAGGANGRELTNDAQIPDWVLRGEESMVSPYCAMRMWELAEHAFEDPQLPLTVVTHLKPGELDLYDYLFTTAPRLRDGFDLSCRYLQLLTTNARLEVEAETDHEVTYSYRYLDADGRGAELALQFPPRYSAPEPAREQGSRSCQFGSRSRSLRHVRIGRSARPSAPAGWTSTHRSPLLPSGLRI
jgi:transcriptional regulator with XRE-family HTH domain